MKVNRRARKTAEKCGVIVAVTTPNTVAALSASHVKE
jgi:hypothetical protein